MPIVLITPEAMREKNGAYVAVLQDAGFEVRYPQNPHFARGLGGAAETIQELQQVDAVIASGELYSEESISALPQLRVIARCGVGYDRVDVAAATRYEKPLTITPTANHEAVAELVMALLFAVAKNLIPNDRQVREGNWPRVTPRALRGQTFGIFGLGRIGRSTALRAQGMGMKVIATEAFPLQAFVEEHEIELVDFDTLLQRSDVLSIHCPVTDETRGMFHRDVFAKMKPGAIFLNTARGKLVVEGDLIESLASGHLYGAGLDVYEREPPAPDNPLFSMQKVVLSPHIAGTDELSLTAMGVEAAECIVKLYRGQWPDGAVVNNELKENWAW